MKRLCWTWVLTYSNLIILLLAQATRDLPPALRRCRACPPFPYCVLSELDRVDPADTAWKLRSVPGLSYIFQNEGDMLDPTSVVYAPELGRGGCMMAAAGVAPKEWNGVVERTISAPLESVWGVASDFLRFPNLLTIEPVEGENGVPGCTRKVSNLPGRTDTLWQQWAKQTLMEIDPHHHLFPYKFLENTGVDPGYYSTFQLSQPFSSPFLSLSDSCSQLPGSHNVPLGLCRQEGGRTLVRWEFWFSPSQAGSDRFVPLHSERDQPLCGGVGEAGCQVLI